MEHDIKSEYQRISDKISYDDFLKRIEEMKKNYEDVSFMDELDIARMIVGEYIDEKNVPLVDKEEEKKPKKIADLELGKQNQNLIGRIMRVSNIKTFKRKKGENGKVANLMIADNSGEIKVVLWNENTKMLDKYKEGDIIEVRNVEIRDGFRGDEEAHLNPRSTIKKLDAKDSDFPEYREKITPITDIKGEMQVNIVARIVRISRIRTFNSNGREGKFITLDLKDNSGSISFTLWNKDVDLINQLNLKEGDSVKILGAQSRVRNEEVSLTCSWIGRIIKGEFDVPEYEESTMKIGDADEMKNVTLMGFVSKIYDKITFERRDGSAGAVKSIEIYDGTGSIKVTLWNDDAELNINKGDILKVTGGNIEFDEYSETGYRVNTGWSSKLTINPEEDAGLKQILEEHKKELEPIKIEDLHKIEDEGEEVDLIGRIVELYDANEFQRTDGSVGFVRSVEIADDTGVVRASFWDEKAKLKLNRGDLIKIENAKTRLRDDKVELNIGKTVRIIKIDENDTQDLPSLLELEESIYKTLQIEEIEKEDKNIKVSGKISEAYGDRILYEMCPNCNKRVEYVDGAFVCDFCGEEIKQPNYLMIIPCVIEDDTGTMRITFFRKLAEELIEITTEEANEVIKKTADEGSLALKVEDLVGSTVTVIADASFDEYNEEVRLIARKIVDRES
ncbi:MAG: OB-fold nucleic acid binding domain-containing protein [Methanobacteriaceae archaeon]|jgi:replication factor A1